MFVLHFFRHLYQRIRERLHFSHLGTKTSLLIMVSVFIPLLISLILFNGYTSDTTAQQQQGNAENSYSQLYDIFSSRFDIVRQDIMLLQIDTNIRDLLQEPLTQADILAIIQKKAQMNSTLDYIENKKIWGVHLRVFLPPSRNILVDDTRFFSSTKVQEEDWYQSFTNAPYKNQWIYQTEAGRDAAFSYLVRVFEPTDYRSTTAVVRLDFSMEDVLHTMQQSLPLIDGATTYLVAENGDVILQASVGDTPPEAIPAEGDISSSAPASSTYSVGIQQYLRQEQSFKYHPWVLVMVLPQATGLALLLSNARWVTLLALTLFCGISIFVLSILFIRSVVNRIAKVSVGMSNLKDGELERLPQPKTMDEIGLLYESYNYLTDELQMLNAGRDMADANQKRAEFVALQAQINPHFLYNTLEMINYFAMVGNAKQVERIVMLLSRFYKRCLNHGAEYTTLAQELELTQTYFSIQEIRYHGKVRFTQDVPEELMNCQVPHIILQPIVENAIHHGIMSTEQQEGTITISAGQKDDALVVSVHDDGAGIPEDQLLLLSKGLEVAFSITEEGSHYGLRNIDKRIKNLYGDAYGLRFASELNVGSTVTLILPIH